MRKYATPVNTVQKEYAFEARMGDGCRGCRPVLMLNVQIGCSVELEVWGWGDSGSGYGPEEYEGSKGG
jgi:hypothetical protein